LRYHSTESVTFSLSHYGHEFTNRNLERTSFLKAFIEISGGSPAQLLEFVRVNSIALIVEHAVLGNVNIPDSKKQIRGTYCKRLTVPPHLDIGDELVLAVSESVKGNQLAGNFEVRVLVVRPDVVDLTCWCWSDFRLERRWMRT
jgi:hypothetical protein